MLSVKAYFLPRFVLTAGSAKVLAEEISMIGRMVQETLAVAERGSAKRSVSVKSENATPKRIAMRVHVFSFMVTMPFDTGSPTVPTGLVALPPAFSGGLPFSALVQLYPTFFTYSSFPRVLIFS